MSWTRRLERLLGWDDRPDADLLHEVRPLVSDELAGDEGFGAVLQHLLGEPFGDHELVRRSRIPRLRPVLVVLAARAAGAQSEEVDRELQLAAELLYVALTVHDVALGPRGGRRRKAMRRFFKRGVGWLGGQQLTLRVMELVRHTGDGAVLDQVLDTLREFTEAQEVARELLDGGELDREAWFEHADGHTGALLSFCCRAGALLAGAPPSEVASLGRYGRNLGRMWHVAEDVAVLAGEDAADQLLSRVMMGRPMLPVVVAAERDRSIVDLWRRVLDEGDPVLAQALLDRMRQVGALQGSREVVQRESWAARRTLRRLEPTPYAGSLERLAQGLATAPFEALKAERTSVGEAVPVADAEEGSA